MSGMEAIKASRYGDNTAGKLLRLTHEICEVESDAGLLIHKTVSWEGNTDVYGGLLGLAPAALKLAPNRRSWLVDSVMLRLDDDGEVKLGMQRDGHQNYADDTFLEYYYDVAATLFYEHNHQDCFEAYRVSQPASTPLSWLNAQRR
jgi:hypothetical protein